MFRRFFDEGLAQSSYLLACDRTRLAVVIDPRRDIDEYVETAVRQGLTITHAIETHVHADFVSGARELAVRGATVVAGPGAGLRFAHQEVAEGTTLRVGALDLEVAHTPGHTPEHITILAREPGAPARAFTGDTLFVGAVGRPDLLGEGSTRRLAEDLFDSIQRLMALNDAVEVWPGHGAGSLCGAGIGADASTTLGHERRVNRLAQHRTRDAFVADVLADLPETPPYFPRMKQLNAAGPAVLDLAHGVGPPPTVGARDAAARIAAGALLVDIRSAADFGDGHPSGAISLSFGPKLGYWAGWVIPPDAPVLVLADRADDTAQAVRQLLRIGIDRVEGWIDGGFAAWPAAGLPVQTIPHVTAAELRERRTTSGALTVLDVRSAREWQAGHIDGALHMPVGEIAARWRELPRAGTIATVCEGGYRSTLAASLLERHGFDHLINVTGGMSAWRTLEPVTS
jgi:hydroxyacylglutathione hydrolase